jgi:putative hydrolase of the HAD superfamily
VFLALGVTLDDRDLDTVATAYRTGYVSARCAMDGAGALLAAIRPHARVGIVTNNLLDEQRDKLAFCGLAPYVDELVVSDAVGVAKPDRGIFEIALQRLGVEADDAVMVGDSWANDIAGALNAGIRAVWFNPSRRPRPEPAAAVTEIHALAPAEDIAAVLLGVVRRGGQ